MFAPLKMPWLTEPPADFRARVKRVADLENGHGSALAQLATHRLNSAQALSFTNVQQNLVKRGISLAPLSPFRLALLSSGTVDAVATALPAAGARHGVALEVVVAEFDQIIQTAFDDSSEIFAKRPDAVLVHFDHRWLGLDRFEPSADAARERVDHAIDRVVTVLRALADRTGQIIVSNLAVPPESLFGGLDASVAGTRKAQIAAFNLLLRVMAPECGALVLDIAAAAEQVGTATWFDPVVWGLYKMPFAAECVPLVADLIARQLGALRGRVRKCLVLDCDNTLWGGVIGDDGLAGINIGPGNAEGESFLAVQQMALEMKRRGVILAICSKNYDEIARGPFLEHPDMALRESDIAVFQANWADKPSNLEAIAASLDIGLDALVFLDDNSAERAQVRAALPMVAVPELPADPAYYPLYLTSAGYFEAVAYSQEDATRADSYLSNARRAEVKQQVRDLGEYLRALEMTLDVRAFDEPGRARIAQLINKSNQFNLTTRRYTEADVRSFERDPAALTLQARLQDKFSDFGMIGVVIARPHDSDPEAYDIDTWLMSCRVLGRRVEEGMLEALVTQVRNAGRRRLYAHYLPTDKNRMVREMFDTLGFELIAEQKNGGRSYRLNLDDIAPRQLPFATKGA
ncbi:HAD-IIIC family phosphatase [Sphingomonas asaccharolytica]|uniref:HAD-IIIC family phosphatase n=1 Tax=Sphingomonas asaccharolytica TaxID=40681 RepID=UPI0008356696|nr:HAD-IIIC family phosphatase [Sphingomonas asaccharolytica]